MFSIIIPLYNKEKYISKSISSVLNQTYTNFELIIVNDGSTDDSLIIGQQFLDTRLTIINQSNLGVSAARNNGVKLAKYDNIAFLDADDWWHPTFLEEMKALIISHSEAALFGSSYFIVKNKQNQRANIGLDEGYVGYIDYFKVYASTFWVPINCSFVVVKKSVFEALGGFKPALKFGEDFDLWVRIALEYQVAYMNKCLAFSNQDVDASSRAVGSKLWRKEGHFIFNIEYLFETEQRLPDLKFLLDGLRVRSLLPYYLQNKYTAEVNAILKKVNFNNHPNYYWILYHFPKPVIRFYILGMKFGLKTKQKIIGWKRLIQK